MQQFRLCLQLPGLAYSCCLPRRSDGQPGPATTAHRRAARRSARALNSISTALNAPLGPAGGNQQILLNKDIPSWYFSVPRWLGSPRLTMLLDGSDAVKPLAAHQVISGMGDVFDWQVSIKSWQAGARQPAVWLCRKPSASSLREDARQGRVMLPQTKPFTSFCIPCNVVWGEKPDFAARGGQTWPDRLEEQEMHGDSPLPNQL